MNILHLETKNKRLLKNSLRVQSSETALKNYIRWYQWKKKSSETPLSQKKKKKQDLRITKSSACKNIKKNRKNKNKTKNAGTKHIDPDTGLIYFKYDFGYEFGIVLPGEGKRTVSSTNRTIQGQRRASDIEVPIVHEFTTRKENGYAKRSSSTASSARPSKSAEKFATSKTVKWEPTSESEFSETEDVRNARKRHQDGVNAMGAPPSLVIPCSSPSPSRWDHTTPSPLSLSPSLPSLSPRYSSATGPPSNVDSAGIRPASATIIDQCGCYHRNLFSLCSSFSCFFASLDPGIFFSFFFSIVTLPLHEFGYLKFDGVCFTRRFD